MIEILALLVGTGTTGLIALTVLVKNSKSITNRLFLFLILSLMGWSITTYFSLHAVGDEQTLFWIRMVMFFVVLQNTAFFLLARVFPASYGKFFRSKRRVGVIIYSFVTALVTLSPFLFESFQEGSPVPGPGMALFLPHAIFCVFGGLVTLIVRTHRARGNERRQFLYFLAGTVALFTLVPISNFVLPVVFKNNALVIFSPLYPIIFAGLIAYAIIRHKLFDIKAAVARAVAYITSLAAIGALYGLLVLGLLSPFIDTLFTAYKQAIYIGLALLTSILYPFVRGFFDKFTNSIFFRDAYDPQTLLDEHNNVVVATNDVDPLLRQSVEIIHEHIKPEYCMVVLRSTAYTEQRIISTTRGHIKQDSIQALRAYAPHSKRAVIVYDELEEDQQSLKDIMASEDIAIIGRLSITQEYEVEGLGYLILGPKMSGNLYTGQDIKILQIITNELVIAVQNALRFEEIEKFNATLQQKVSDATAQLRKTNSKLKAMDETKDEFISMASHQLRTPLTSVKGYLSMVIEGDAGDLNEMQTKLLNQAFASSQRMVYLIADLLNVSRLRTGKFVIESRPTNLADAVQDEITQLQEVAKARDLTLNYAKPADFPVLPLDETKIRQVVMNFTDNAIYYTPAGGTIDVSVTDTGKSIEFRVKDTGMGVPKDEQQHLFSKFHRAGNAKKARPDGTGLGLFMAKKVVIAQGGSIIFESKEGKGSTFGFSFAKQKLEETANKPQVYTDADVDDSSNN